MTRYAVLAVLAIGCLVGDASARLALQDIQAAQGPLLPERPTLEYLPQEVVFFRYTVLGARTDADGQFDVEAVVKLTDVAGKEAGTQKISLKGALSLGGDSFGAVAWLVLAEELVPGHYHLKVAVTDRSVNDTMDFERDLLIKPSDFAVLHPQFSFDAEGRVPSPAGGLVNQSLHFRVPVVGLDKGQERVELVSRVQVLGRDGKELLPRPLETIIKESDPKIIKKTAIATFTGSLGLHRPGTFTLRIIVTDRVTNKSATVEVPLKVEAP